MLAGVPAYAEFFDEVKDSYHGLPRAEAVHANIVIDGQSLIVRTDIAEQLV